MYLIVHVGYVYHYGVAVGVELTLDGQRVEVLCVVLGNLLAIHAQTLCEIAKAIQETYCTHVDIAV